MSILNNTVKICQLRNCLKKFFFLFTLFVGSVIDRFYCENSRFLTIFPDFFDIYQILAFPDFSTKNSRFYQRASERSINWLISRRNSMKKSIASSKGILAKYFMHLCTLYIVHTHAHLLNFLKCQQNCWNNNSNSSNQLICNEQTNNAGKKFECRLLFNYH